MGHQLKNFLTSDLTLLRKMVLQYPRLLSQLGQSTTEQKWCVWHFSLKDLSQHLQLQYSFMKV